VNAPTTGREVYALTYLHTSAGTTTLPTATLKLRKGGVEVEEAATGDGPVDAVFNAIDRATGFKGKLVNYTLKALTQGRDAQGEVSVILSVGGEEVHGRGVSTDVIEASAKAYLNGREQVRPETDREKHQGALQDPQGHLRDDGTGASRAPRGAWGR
jgi:2-isopropylmalate synthase